MNKSLKEYFSEEEQPLFFHALYIFVSELDEKLSVEENLNHLIRSYNERIEKGPDLSLMGRASLERDIHAINEAVNKKREMFFLKEHLEKLEGLLSKILKDSTYRAAVEDELQGYLFTKPSFFSRFLDTLVRMYGNSLGILER